MVENMENSFLWVKCIWNSGNMLFASYGYVIPRLCYFMSLTIIIAAVKYVNVTDVETRAFLLPLASTIYSAGNAFAVELLTILFINLLDRSIKIGYNGFCG